jgi:hypothetical protein
LQWQRHGSAKQYHALLWLVIYSTRPLSIGLTDEVFQVRSILRHQQVFTQGGVEQVVFLLVLKLRLVADDDHIGIQVRGQLWHLNTHIHGIPSARRASERVVQHSAKVKHDDVVRFRCTCEGTYLARQILPFGGILPFCLQVIRLRDMNFE